MPRLDALRKIRSASGPPFRSIPPLLSRPVFSNHRLRPFRRVSAQNDTILWLPITYLPYIDGKCKDFLKPLLAFPSAGQHATARPGNGCGTTRTIRKRLLKHSVAPIKCDSRRGVNDSFRPRAMGIGANRKQGKNSDACVENGEKRAAACGPTARSIAGLTWRQTAWRPKPVRTTLTRKMIMDSTTSSAPIAAMPSPFSRMAMAIPGAKMSTAIVCRT